MDTRTIDTYDRGASYYSKKFTGIGSRVKDIERAFVYVNKQFPTTLELGCGDGRDAKEICKRTNRYIGIDASKQLLNVARKRVSRATFYVADIESYEFESGIDVVFAFASLLHVPRGKLKDVFKRAHKALNKGGIFYISTKEGIYNDGGAVVTDENWDRVFYLYSESDLRDLSCGYTVQYINRQIRGKTKWLTFVIKK